MPMAHEIKFVPGAVLAGVNIDIPSTAPLIDAVASAYIIRTTAGVTVGNHTQAQVAGALADHAVHAHDFISTGIGGVVANAMGLPAGLNAINDAGAVGAHTVPGGGASGVQNNAAAQAHAAGAAPLAHALTGANPIVAAVPTKVDGNTITLDVPTVLGDILSLTYIPVGGRLQVA